MTAWTVVAAVLVGAVAGWLVATWRHQDRALSDDAANRALRTLLQALGAELLITLGPPVLAALGDESRPLDVDLGRSLARVAATTAISFCMRRVLDPSRFPTPLPPVRQPPPTTADPAP